MSTAASALAEKLGKEVDVSVDGGGIRLDSERWERFWSSFVHAVRNAVDHGLEAPEERAERGKGATGILRLRAVLTQDDFAIELQDDGRGIAWSTIAERLRARGHAAQTTEDLVEGLFADGVSTAMEVTEVSGRGVGMGALREVARALGGSIEVRSTLNGGTTIRCVFPGSCATVDPSWVLEREMARSAASRSACPTRADRVALRRAA
jgi:two-component system chemotaxis sensor kinase CheA